MKKKKKGILNLFLGFFFSFFFLFKFWLCVYVIREREKRPWNVIVFFIPAFYFSIWNFWFVFSIFFFFGEFWPEAKLEPFRFWISSIHPSIFFFSLFSLLFYWAKTHPKKKKKNTSRSPESENARVCLCALLSYYYYYYYIQQCERQRLEKESGVHLRGSLLFFFFWNDQDRIENRHGKKKYHLHLISFSLSPLDRKLTFSCVLCQVFTSFSVEWYQTECGPGGDFRGES